MERLFRGEIEPCWQHAAEGLVVVAQGRVAGWRSDQGIVCALFDVWNERGIDECFLIGGARRYRICTVIVSVRPCVVVTLIIVRARAESVAARGATRTC